MPNCVAGKCTLTLDCRFWTNTEKERLEKGIRDIAKQTFIDGTNTSIRFYSVFLPFEQNPHTQRFYEHCCNTAKEFGFPVPLSSVAGGSSDASWMSLHHVPAICSFGVQGEWNHTMQEYAIVDTMYSRAKFIAAIILNKAKFV